MSAPDPSEAVAILTSLQRFFGTSNNSVPSAPSTFAATAANTNSVNPINAAPPPIQPYISQREPVSLGHPAAAAMPSNTPTLASMPVSTTPFRDGHFRDLIPQVDRDRRDGAARNRQNPPPLQRRTANSGRNQNQNQNQRTRGSAVPFPTLGRRDPAPSIDDTLMTLPSGEQLLRIQVSIHLPDPNGAARVIHHVTRANAVEAFRTKMDLQPQFQVPLGTSVSDLMTMVATRLASSDHCYVLPEPALDALNRVEPQFLVLEFTNAGRRGSASNVVYMRTCRMDLQAKVADLATTRHIAVPQWAIKEGYFQVHFLINAPQVEARFSLAEAGLGTETAVRHHVCLAERFHLPHYFGADQRTAVPSSETGFCDCPPDDEEEVSIDLMAVSSDDENLISSPPTQHTSGRRRRRRSLTPAVQPRPRISGTPPRDTTTSVTTRSTLGRSNAPSDAAQSTPALPEPRLRGFGIPVSLFAVEYTIPDQIASLSESVMEVRDLVKYVRNTVHPRRSAAPATLIVGANVEDAARNLLSKMEVCFQNRDFSSILSPNRFFEVGNPINGVTSTGDGVESEVVSVAWKSLFENQHAYFFRMSGGDKCTLACSVPNAMSYTIPAAQKDKLGVLGAMAALMIVYGKYPFPLSPAFLQFIIHDTNPLSLTPSFVSEWLPEINSTLRQFRLVAIHGDASAFQPFFQSYTGLDANTLKDRTPEFHDTIASLMLYQSTISFEPPTHPEIQAFLTGFKLPAENHFDFAKVIRRSFRGGSEALLSQISLSHISGPESVKDHVAVEVPSTALVDRLTRLFDEPFEFVRLLEDFLTGIGAPCPDLWADLLPHLNECVRKRLEDVDQPYFRAQVFFWAATGSPEIRADLVDGTVQILLVEDNDEQYMDGTSTSDDQARLRRAMLDEGKICFRTCAAVVRIPASYLEKLVRECTSASIPILPRIHHWLLSECLNAVGKHSMI
ncbi:hypothetical protein VKT23_014838 [Stygiomarasmius scandens]|uniref:HECT domain-containing protein n=1 Tax=Marasmiellus scandens TaxID=2682957 RepID=A0ABR1J2K9_9AGAR